MRHIWSIICQTSIIDSNTNSISLINLVDQFEFQIDKTVEVDGIPIPVEFITLWKRDEPDIPEQANIRLVLTSPEGKELFTSPEQLIDLAQRIRHRQIMRLPGIPFTSSGEYLFKTQIWDEPSETWLDVAAVPLDIIQKYAD